MQQSSKTAGARWRTVMLTVTGVVALVTALDTALDAQAVTRSLGGETPIIAAATGQPDVTVADDASPVREMATAAPMETCTATSGAE
ncbi:MAG TPA: hypothetical protein PKE51_08635 [Gemmatimonadaceae bacterium]|nr:hypothetical protein [Gemmatimonadaceae bacterium]